MKILHIATGFSLDYNGGITNYVRAIAKAQFLAGNEVYVLADEGKDDGYKVIKYSSKIKRYGYDKKDKKALYRCAQFIKSGFDLIHIHMVLNMDWDLYKCLENEKYIVSLHDYFFICPRIQMFKGNVSCGGAPNGCDRCISVLERYRPIRGTVKRVLGDRFVQSFPLKDKKLYINWLNHYKPLLENAQLLLPVSSRVEEIFKNFGINNEYKVLHIGNITAENFPQGTNLSDDGKIRGVLLSSMVSIKGGDLICSMLKRVQNSKLEVHFWGRANEKQCKMMSDVGIINHGPYKQTELPQILSKMDFGINVPIWEDNGPQVVMEMLNNKLPVFGTHMGGIPDFVNDKNGYLFDPYSSTEIDKAVDFLDDLTIEKILLLKNNITPTLTPQEHYFQLQKIYDELLG